MIVSICREEIIDPIVFAGCSGLFATPTPTLCSVLGQGVAFEFTRMLKGNYLIGWGDEIFCVELGCIKFNFRATNIVCFVGEFFFDSKKFVGNNIGNTFWTSQNIE